MEWSLHTERLKIRKVTKEDAPFFVTLLNTPHWLKYIGNRNVHTVEDAEKYLDNGILKSYDTLRYGFYMVETKEGVRIGICGLVKRDFLDDVDIGFAFLPEFEGKGYGFESAMSVLNYTQKNLQMERLVAITTRDNYSSQHLLEKIGMKYEREIVFPGDDTPLMLFGMFL
ncbi:MAG: GNAT family N-acetyltransferase [Chitinophagales bacterium]|nr:GNAT family N-acetyltransferase [Chitinophagales bacterium]